MSGGIIYIPTSSVSNYAPKQFVVIVFVVVVDVLFIEYVNVCCLDSSNSKPCSGK